MSTEADWTLIPGVYCPQGVGTCIDEAQAPVAFFTHTWDDEAKNDRQLRLLFNAPKMHKAILQARKLLNEGRGIEAKSVLDDASVLHLP